MKPKRRRKMWRVVATVFGATLILLTALGAAGYAARFEILRWQQELPPFSHSAGRAIDHRLPMHDDVLLSTTVYMPEGDGPWPALLVRNPYEGFHFVVRNWCQLLVRYGYACVYQDARGQIDSEGEWQPLANEAKDGATTLTWLVAQSWQDGNIALFGPSYLAATQWATAAIGFPPEVKTFIPSVFTTDLSSVMYEHGMFRHETFTAWAAVLPRRGFVATAGDAYRSALRHRPHIEVDELFFGGRLDWYRDWVSSPSRSAPMWQQQDFQRLVGAPESIELPVLMIAGWYDVFLGPQLRDFQRLRSRARSTIIIGPWNHLGRSGEAVDTPSATGGLEQWSIVLDWLAHHLKGEPIADIAGVVRTYILGEDRWATRSTWPPTTTNRRLHIGQVGAATRCDGGRLVAKPPTTADEVTFTYDPENPVPTRGGSGMLAHLLPGLDGAAAGNVWQGDLCARADILSFLSEPLIEPMHIAGEITVTLTVATDAPDTSFTAKLIEVLPDGGAVNIRDSITSLAYRDDSPTPLPYEPGQPVEIEIEFWPIEWRVAAGSRLRLDVSSSDFPKFHIHPNRAGPWAEQTDAVPARQTLMVGPDSPGYVDLPVVVDPEIAATP